jgi:hypothetical protein
VRRNITNGTNGATRPRNSLAVRLEKPYNVGLELAEKRSSRNVAGVIIAAAAGASEKGAGFILRGLPATTSSMRTGETMRQWKTVVAFLGFFLALAPGLRAQMMAGSTADQPREFQIKAKNYSFSPFVVIVNQGDQVQLIVTAMDRDYGFRLKAFRINRKLKQNIPTTIAFTADKMGKFTFRSSSSPPTVALEKTPLLNHLRHEMKGTLVVKSPSKEALPPPGTQYQ